MVFFVQQMAGLHIFGDMNFTFVASEYVNQDKYFGQDTWITIISLHTDMMQSLVRAEISCQNPRK